MSETSERVYPMLLDFVRKERISEHLWRVTVTSEELIGFPEDQNGKHIKVFFPNRENGILQFPYMQDQQIVWPEHKPVPRAYTVRKYHADVNELDIDFVVHGEHSPGGGWAMKATKGSQIGLVGPSGPDLLLVAADWHILAGDLTAVPAISAILEGLPSDSQGYVFIEIDSVADKHDIHSSQGITVKWLVRTPSSGSDLLSSAITGLTPPDGQNI